MIKAIFFDLDGTLLPLNEEEFTKNYFHLMSNYMKQYGYEENKLIDTIWKGTYAMIKNDGSKKNDEVFWDYFEGVYGSEAVKDKSKFDVFYSNDFLKLKNICGSNDLACDIVKYCRENVSYVVLSTNPIFPYIGTENRMGFIGLKPSDFDFVTAYENFEFCKPNPKYFQKLLDMFNLKGEEVILFGNNTLEDGECSLACGIKCYLVLGNLINNPKATHTFPVIKMEDIIPTIAKEIKENC